VHGRGVADLLDRVIDLLPAETPLEEEDEETIRLAIIGRPNVGKSSLLNAILGEDRAIVSPIPGTTRDTIDTPFEWDGQKLALIDTAGIRRNRKIQGTVEYYMVLRARSALERCHVGVVVVDGAAGLSDGDKRVAGLAHEAGKGCIVVVNKWDLVDPKVIYEKGKPRHADRDRIEKFTLNFRNECPFLSYAPLVFVSAQERFSIKAVVETAITAAQNHAHRIPTGELNRIVREAFERRPYASHGKALKIYYATMASVEPPTIIVFCNDTELLHFSYQRYLENRIREVYPLEGTPLRLFPRMADKKDREETD
jgi:GTP-binding protein